MKGIPQAFGILKTGTSGGTPQYRLKVADATKGTLTTAHSGTAPGNWQLLGAMLLATEAAAADLLAVGYGK
jgi:hypothetical protein